MARFFSVKYVSHVFSFFPLLLSINSIIFFTILLSINSIYLFLHILLCVFFYKFYNFFFTIWLIMEGQNFFLMNYFEICVREGGSYFNLTEILLMTQNDDVHNFSFSLYMMVAPNLARLGWSQCGSSAAQTPWLTVFCKQDLSGNVELLLKTQPNLDTLISSCRLFLLSQGGLLFCFFF